MTVVNIVDTGLFRAIGTASVKFDQPKVMKVVTQPGDTMASDQTRTPGREAPEDPADFLPEDSVLTLDEYLDMYAAVGNRIQYEVCYRLVHGDSMSFGELEEAMDVPDSTLHYHLNRLIEVGLIQKRQRTERGDERVQTYYASTVFGRVTLTEGVDELIQGEQEFEGMYDSSVGAE